MHINEHIHHPRAVQHVRSAQRIQKGMQLQRPFHMSPIRSNIGKLPNTTHFSRTSPLCHETRITAGRRLRPLVESGHQRIDHPTGSAIPVGQRTIHPGTEQHTATPQDTARSSYRLAWALRSQHHPWEPPVHSHSNPPGSQRKLTASEYHTLSPLKPTHSPSTGRGSFWPSTGAAHFRNHISSHSHQWLSGPEGPRARRRTGSRGQYQKRQFQRTVRLRNSPQRPTVLEARLGIDPSTRLVIVRRPGHPPCRAAKAFCANWGFSRNAFEKSHRRAADQGEASAFEPRSPLRTGTQPTALAS